ncbi:MAG TPA: DUF2905 domain-containing protein [Terriglobales bacterium]|jgi:hypothetical protein
MSDLGKLLLFVGALLMVGGLVLIFLGRAHVPLGRLPGDITYRGKNTTIYFPLASSIVVSILLTLILYVISLFRR